MEQAGLEGTPNVGMLVSHVHLNQLGHNGNTYRVGFKLFFFFCYLSLSVLDSQRKSA